LESAGSARYHNSDTRPTEEIDSIRDEQATVILHLPILESALADLDSGKPVALCAVVRTRGSTPQSPGALLVIDQAMNARGTLGGGCVEAEIRKRAFEMLRKNESGLLSFQLDHDYGWDDGLICGGGMDVVVMSMTQVQDGAMLRHTIDDIRAGRDARLVLTIPHDNQPHQYRVRIRPEPKLVIAGAGHIGAQLARMCVDLEFDVTVIDDRADFANPERLPPPIHVAVGDIEHTLRTHPIGPDSYVVIVTRGHNHDEQALSAVIDSNTKYIGLIGSRRKIKLIFDDLVEAGVDPKLLERVHAPIGVDINAVTVPEIAVSIAAQLIAVRRADKHKLVEGPLPANAGASQ
jgi:xanthine dehydrogenase accessory factor